MKGQCRNLYSNINLTSLVSYLKHGAVLVMFVDSKGRHGAVGCSLARNVEVVVSSPIKGPRCFLEQETLHLLLITG